MSYRLLDPALISFAAGLRPEDPLRLQPGASFEGFARPHADLAWLPVAVPTTELAPAEFRLVEGMVVRASWSEWNLGRRERDVVAGMLATLRSGGRLPPVLVVGARQPRLIDGYHRVAAALSYGAPEVEALLLADLAGHPID